MKQYFSKLNIMLIVLFFVNFISVILYNTMKTKCLAVGSAFDDSVSFTNCTSKFYDFLANGYSDNKIMIFTIKPMLYIMAAISLLIAILNIKNKKIKSCLVPCFIFLIYFVFIILTYSTLN